MSKLELTSLLTIFPYVKSIGSNMQIPIHPSIHPFMQIGFLEMKAIMLEVNNRLGGIKS